MAVSLELLLGLLSLSAATLTASSGTAAAEGSSAPEAPLQVLGDCRSRVDNPLIVFGAGDDEAFLGRCRIARRSLL